MRLPPSPLCLPVALLLAAAALTTGVAAAGPAVYRYGDEASGITEAAQGTAARQVLPPYSIETVVLHPQAGTESALSAPGSPSASNVTAAQATISWTRPAAAPWTSTR